MDYRQRRSKISLWPQTRPQAVRMAFYSMPLTIAAMTPAPKLRKRNGSVEFGCLYDPGTEPAWGPLAGVSGIAVRSAVRTAAIPAPMRARAILTAAGTVETGELAGTNVKRTDPAGMSPPFAAAPGHAYAPAPPAPPPDPGAPSPGPPHTRPHGHA